MLKVLIIEDNNILIEDITSYFVLEGLITLNAKNYSEGVKIINDLHPDFILCNIDLAEYEGDTFQCFSDLSMRTIDSNIPTIFISFEEEIVLIKNPDINWYVFEPITPKVLAKYINTVFEVINHKEQNYNKNINHSITSIINPEHSYSIK